MGFKEKIKLGLFLLVLALLFCVVIELHSEVKHNFKYEVTEDRIVVSCVDGQNPIIRTVPRPQGGYYAVVVCEGRNR